jgi:integrase/recombinase XerD
MSNYDTTLNDFTQSTENPQTSNSNEPTSSSEDEASPTDAQETATDSSQSPEENELDPEVESFLDQRESVEPFDDVNLETGSKVATQCFREEAEATIKKSVARRYACSFRQYVEFIDCSVIDADESDVREFIKQRARNNRRGKTLGVDLPAIKKVYNWLKYLDINMDVALLNDISPSEFKTPDPINREALDREELEELYDALDRPRDKLMATIAAELGPRNVDVTKIKIDDIDFEANEIKLNNSKAGRTYTLPISPVLSVDLMHYLNQQRDAHVVGEENEYLFPSGHGGKLSRQRFNEIVKNAAEKAGLQEVIGTAPAEPGVDAENGPEVKYHRVTPHALRHTFNVLMKEAGIPAESRSDALDQDSIDVNKKYYTPDSEEYKELIRESLHKNLDSD